jgi:cobalt-zinc-cadmium efflux system protein
MDSVPVGVDLDRLTERMASVSGVHEVHHVHVWQIDEHNRALEAHVVSVVGFEDSETIKGTLKKLLHEEFEISHTTLEFEPQGGCLDGSGPCA